MKIFQKYLNDNDVVKGYKSEGSKKGWRECKNYFNDKFQFNNKLQFVGEITYKTGLSVTGDDSKIRNVFIVKCSHLINSEERGHEKKNKAFYWPALKLVHLSY